MGEEEEDGTGGAAVEEAAAAVAGDEFTAAIATFLSEVVDSARLDEATVIRAVGCDLLATESDGRSNDVRGVVTLRLVMAAVTGPFSEPWTI